MTTEIELKYQLLTTNKNNNAIVADITAMLNANNRVFEMNQHKLVNDYFDNNNLDLRKMDFGLRIRTKMPVNSPHGSSEHLPQYEQTIKTAGKVNDGLHQRPEYNVALANNTLNLSLFPTSIWPENSDVIALQNSVKVLFSTNFLRHTWLIQQGESIIELALDKGDICTSPGKPRVVINEIEIELVSGNEQGLFTLAEQLKEIVAIEPSNISKAARGYELYYAKT